MEQSRRTFLSATGKGLGGLLLGTRLSPDSRASASARARTGRHILFLAGADSHGFGEHEHDAGCRLLADRLGALPGVRAEVVSGGWPPGEDAFAEVDAVVFFGDGGGRYPVTGHEELVDELAKRGVGLGFLHYALIPPDEAHYGPMLDWIGGYYEPGWSVNPIWNAEVTALPEHPVTRGVRPFEIDDEWYYHMRFRAEMRDVRPLLTAVPPEETRQRPHGPHSGNPHVEARAGRPEHLAWVATRDGGGRGFGFTGGHWHWNWAHDDYRTFVLNAVAWLAGMEIPAVGIPSRTPTLTELLAPLGEPPAGFEIDEVEKRLEKWRELRRPAREPESTRKDGSAGEHEHEHEHKHEHERPS